MKRPYFPQPGTAAYRVICHFQNMPRGHELSTAQLAELLGQNPSTTIMLLEAPRKHGLLRVRKQPDGARLLFWSLPNHMHETTLPVDEFPEPAAEEEDPHQPVQVVLQPGQWPPPIMATQLDKKQQNRVKSAHFDGSGCLVLDTTDQRFVLPKRVANRLLQEVRGLV